MRLNHDTFFVIVRRIFLSFIKISSFAFYFMILHDLYGLYSFMFSVTATAISFVNTVGSNPGAFGLQWWSGRMNPFHF